jgi:hypothetical protein
MPWHDVDRFLKMVCSQIRYKGAHAGISDELRNHIQDRIFDFVDSGYDEETAIKKALEAMGDPEDIGKKLNKLHKPYLGWLLSAVNVSIVIVGIYVALAFIPSIISFIRPFNSIPKGKDVKYSAVINKKARIDDRTVVIKKLIVDKDNRVYIRYDDYSKPFSHGWTMMEFQVYDDKGNVYNLGSASTGSIFGTRHLMYIDNLKSDAKVIILNYDFYNRKMRFELPLSGGGNL